MHWLTWVGLLFIALGTALTLMGQQKVNDKSTQLLQAKSDKIAELAQENIRLSSELSEINKKIAATVTGGESFCYLFPSLSFGELNSIDFNLQHMGEYPVYDASIRVWDSSCLERIDYTKIFESHHGYRTKEVTYEEWLAMKEDPQFIRPSKELGKGIKKQMEGCLLVQKNLGTITPKKSTNIMDPSLITFTVPTGIDVNTFKQKYSVSIVARNGEYRQEISIDIRNKRYHIYSKVEKVSTRSEPVVVREYETIESEPFAIKLIK
jgi:hypothetical protein